MDVLFRSLRRNDPSVTRIDTTRYKHKKCGSSIAKKLGHALQQNEHVVAMDCLRLSLLQQKSCCQEGSSHSGDDENSDDITMLLQFFRTSKSLRIIHLYNDTKEDDDTDPDNHAVQNFLEQVLGALAESTHVVELKLRGFVVRSSYSAFGPFLQRTKSVQTLALLECSFPTAIQSQEASDSPESMLLLDATAATYQALETNRSVEILQVEGVAIRELSIVIQSTPMLKKLYIAKVHFEKSAMEALVREMLKMKWLKSLCISNCVWDPNATIAFHSFLTARVLETANTLSKLELGFANRKNPLASLPTNYQLRQRQRIIGSELQVLHLDGFVPTRHFDSLIHGLHWMPLRCLHVGRVSSRSCGLIVDYLPDLVHLAEFSLGVNAFKRSSRYNVNWSRRLAKAMRRNASLHSVSICYGTNKKSKKQPFKSIFTPAEDRTVQKCCQRNAKIMQFLKRQDSHLVNDEGKQSPNDISSESVSSEDKDLDVIHFPLLLQCIDPLQNTKTLRRQILFMGLVTFGGALGSTLDSKRLSLPL